jgi:hypothetical protein
MLAGLAATAVVVTAADAATVKVIEPVERANLLSPL